MNLELLTSFPDPLAVATAAGPGFAADPEATPRDTFAALVAELAAGLSQPGIESEETASLDKPPRPPEGSLVGVVGRSFLAAEASWAKAAGFLERAFAGATLDDTDDQLVPRDPVKSRAADIRPEAATESSSPFIDPFLLTPNPIAPPVALVRLDTPSDSAHPNLVTPSNEGSPYTAGPSLGGLRRSFVTDSAMELDAKGDAGPFTTRNSPNLSYATARDDGSLVQQMRRPAVAPGPSPQLVRAEPGFLSADLSADLSTDLSADLSAEARWAKAEARWAKAEAWTKAVTRSRPAIEQEISAAEETEDFTGRLVVQNFRRSFSTDDAAATPEPARTLSPSAQRLLQSLTASGLASETATDLAPGGGRPQSGVFAAEFDATWESDPTTRGLDRTTRVFDPIRQLNVTARESDRTTGAPHATTTDRAASTWELDRATWEPSTAIRPPGISGTTIPAHTAVAHTSSSGFLDSDSANSSPGLTTPPIRPTTPAFDRRILRVAPTASEDTSIGLELASGRDLVDATISAAGLTGQGVRGPARDSAVTEPGVLRQEAASSGLGEPGTAMPVGGLRVGPVSHSVMTSPFGSELLPSVDLPYATAEDLAAADVPHQIVRAVRFQTQNGVSEARVRLHPAHLGEVTVEVRVDRGAVSASVYSELALVRGWIESHSQTLRDALAEQGLNLREFVVGDETQRRQAQHHHRDQSRRRRRWHAAPHEQFKVEE